MSTSSARRASAERASVHRASPRRARERLITGAFVRLAIADLAYFTAAGVGLLAIPVYVTGPIGSDEAGAGLAFGAFAVSALALRPLVGRWCDSWGRVPLMIGGGVLAAICLALTAQADSLAMVVAFRLVLGVAEAAFFVASMAVLVDIAPESRRGEALSYNSLGLYLGIALGPPLAELLIRAVGFAGAWYVAGGLALTAAAVAATIRETRPRGARRARGAEPRPPLIHRAAIAPGLGFLASVVAMGGFLALASLHAGAVGVGAISTPILVYGAVVIVGRIGFGWLMDRLPPLRLGAVALVAIAAGLVVAATVRTPIGILLGAALLAVGVVFSTPAFFAAIFATAGPAERGAASGTASAALDLGLGLGPMLLGVVASAAGTSWAFVTAAGVAIIGAVWTVSLARSTSAADRRHVAGA